MSFMTHIFRKDPAPQSNIRGVLILCVLLLSAMSVALLWQAQIIANQQQDIRWLETLKFGA